MSAIDLSQRPSIRHTERWWVTPGPRTPELVILVCQLADGPWLTRRVSRRGICDLREELHDNETAAENAATRFREGLADHVTGEWTLVRWPE